MSWPNSGSSLPPPCLFSHFLILRAQDSLPPNPPSPLVTHQLIAATHIAQQLAANASASNGKAPLVQPTTLSSPDKSDSNAFPPSLPAFVYSDSYLLQKYESEDYTDEKLLFVLTSESGERLYGYTRRFLPVGSSPRYPDALCFLSRIYAPSLFHELLEHAQVRWLLQPASLFTLLSFLLTQAPYPKPGSLFPLEWSASESSLPASARTHQPNQHTTVSQLAKEWMLLERKDESLQPRTSLLPLMKCLSLDNLMLLFSAILLEQRMLFVSRKLEKISDCIQAAVALIQPLEWHHILVPLLPKHLLNYCLAPMPYIIGTHELYVDELLTMAGVDGNILIIDLDADRISASGERYTQLRSLSQEDLEQLVADAEGNGTPLTSTPFTFPLPEEAGAKLKKQLKSKGYSNSVANNLNVDMKDQDLFEAFQVFFLQLFAHIDWESNDIITLDKRGKMSMEGLLSVSENIAPQVHEFLTLISQSQSVERFMEEQCLKYNAQRRAAPLSPSQQAALALVHPQMKHESEMVRDRFENVRRELVAAAAHSLPKEPLEETRSFSFVLKVLRKHLEQATNQQEYQMNTALLQQVDSSSSPLAHLLSAGETKKQALELTSNSNLHPKKSQQAILSALSIASFDTRCFPLLLNVVWERLTDSKKGNWAHGYKALGLLEYLLHHGSDRVVLHCLTQPLAVKLLQALAYTYAHENEKTQDMIRNIALRIQTLLGNIFMLRKTRRYVNLMDLRKFKYYGNLEHKSAAASKDGKSAATTIVDPDFDEYRHRSLVEMSAAAFPPFRTLHDQYRGEFDSQIPSSIQRRSSFTSSGVAPSPGVQRAMSISKGQGAFFAANINSPVSVGRGGLTQKSSDGSTNGADAGEWASFDTESEFDFAAFETNFAGMNQASPGLQAIMPPAATTTPATAVSKPSKPVAPSQGAVSNSKPLPSNPQTVPAKSSPGAVVGNIIDTSLFNVSAPVLVPLADVKAKVAAAKAGITPAGSPSTSSIVLTASATVKSSPPQPTTNVNAQTARSSPPQSTTNVATQKPPAVPAVNSKAATPATSPAQAHSQLPPQPPSNATSPDPFGSPPAAFAIAAASSPPAAGRTTAAAAPTQNTEHSPWAAFDDAFATAPAPSLGAQGQQAKAIMPPPTSSSGVSAAVAAAFPSAAFDDPFASAPTNLPPPATAAAAADPTLGLVSFFSATAPVVSDEKKKKKKKDEKK